VGLQARGRAAVARHSRVPAVLALLEWLLYSYTLFSGLLYSGSLLYCSPPLLLSWPLFYGSTPLVLYCSRALLLYSSWLLYSVSQRQHHTHQLLTPPHLFFFLFSFFFCPLFLHTRPQVGRADGADERWGLGVVGNGRLSV